MGNALPSTLRSRLSFPHALRPGGVGLLPGLKKAQKSNSQLRSQIWIRSVFSACGKISLGKWGQADAPQTLTVHQYF